MGQRLGERSCKVVHLVESVGKRIVSTWGRADGFPEIDDQFVPPWCGFSFGCRLQGADQLDGGLEGQCKRCKRSRLLVCEWKPRL